MQERRHGLRVSRTGRRFLATVISLSAQQLENLSKVASECKLWVATIGDPISGFEVFKHRCANHCLSVGEYTTKGGVTVLYGDKGYMFHKGSFVERFSMPRLHDCLQRKQHVQHLHDREETRLMRYHCLRIQTIAPRGVAGRVRTCKIGESRSRRSRRSRRSARSMVTSRGCQIFLLNPVRDRSLNMS